jgi:uncharacterized protein YaaQ
MKLALCVIHNRDKAQMMTALVSSGFKFTVIGSSGGFLREGNTTMIIGTEDDQVAGLRSLIEENCQTREQVVSVMPFESGPPGAYLTSPVKVPVGGAVMFVMDVDEYHRF